MQGYQRTFLATLATLLLANAVIAQEVAPVSAPIITNVTPGDASGVIGFVPSRVAEGTPAVREYIASCESVGNPGAGVIETIADVEALIGSSITIQGLVNGEDYQCTMIARAVTGGLVPRAINSEPSNPSPVFSPSAEGGPTIFVSQGAVPPVAPVDQPEDPDAEAAVEPETAATEDPDAEAIVEPETVVAEEPAAEAVEEPETVAAEEPAAEVVEEPAAEAVEEPETVAAEEPAVEATEASDTSTPPPSSAVRAAASAIVAGVVAAAFVV